MMQPFNSPSCKKPVESVCVEHPFCSMVYYSKDTYNHVLILHNLYVITPGGPSVVIILCKTTLIKNSFLALLRVATN